MAHLVAPSLLAANFADLKTDLEMVEKSQADWHHLDVMDGVFVPNISFGIPVIKAINKHTTKTLDVHLMIVDPDRYIDDFKNAGADVLSVHYEACTHLHRTIHAIKDAGMKAGVALNPHTSVDLLKDTISDIDLVVLMSVNPGFGGQKFIEGTYEKVRSLKKDHKRSWSTNLDRDRWRSNQFQCIATDRSRCGRSRCRVVRFPFGGSHCHGGKLKVRQCLIFLDKLLKSNSAARVRSA